MELNEQLDLEPVRWSTDKLRTVRYETSTSTIVARSRGILQSVYQFSTERSGNLALRRVSGLTYRESLSNLVWMQGYTSDGVDIQIGIDPAYIFEQTGCLITPKIVSCSVCCACSDRLVSCLFPAYQIIENEFARHQRRE